MITTDTSDTRTSQDKLYSPDEDGRYSSHAARHECIHDTSTPPEQYDYTRVARSCRQACSQVMPSMRAYETCLIWQSDLAGDTPPARTERVIRSAPSRPHSPKVCACGDAKSLDGRHRVRRRGVSPTRSDAFRYLPSDPTVPYWGCGYSVRVV